MKISFIIPVYNAEPYLQLCVDSIFQSALTDEEIEIIMVDDGSKDDSVTIAKKICAEHSNAILIEQSNQGSSVARNTGIEQATGDYIWFVDSDDYLETPLLNQIKEDIITLSFPDIYAIQLKILDGDASRTECAQPHVQHNTILKGRDAILSGYQPSSACAIICKRDFICQYHLRFYVGISHQDVELTMRAVALAETIYFSDYQAYIYIKHSGSVSRPKTVEHQYFYTIGDLYVALSYQKFIQKLNDKELSDYILRWSNTILVNLVLSLRKNNNPLIDETFKDKVLAEMKEHKVYPLKGPFMSWKITILSKLLNIL